MTWRMTTVAALMVAVSVILGGCATSKPPRVAAGAAIPAQYLIGPGDNLEIFVWNNPDLSVTIPVRPDGRISTPLVEDMQAVGKTPTQLARDLESALANYIKTPQVNVVVRQFVGTFAEQVRVVGKAARPAALPYRRGMTVLDVMIEVGGLAPGAAGNRAKLLRLVDGQKSEIRLRIEDLMNDGDLSQNVEILPGDVLVIPESRL